MLESKDGGRRSRILGVFPVALHLRAVAVSGNRIWVGGDTKRGRGLLLDRSGAQGRWRGVTLPGGVNEVRDVAVIAGDVWVAGRAGRTGILLKRSGNGWREAARVRPPSRGRAVLVSLSVAGSSVVAAGSDGAAGVMVFSTRLGERSKTVRTQRLDSATAVAEAWGEILVTGYRAPGGVVENAIGRLLRSTLQAERFWLRTFKGTTQLLDVSFRPPKTAYIIATTGRGDVAWRSRTGGKTWTKLLGAQGLTIERLVDGGSFYAVGGSGLLHIP